MKRINLWRIHKDSSNEGIPYNTSVKSQSRFPYCVVLAFGMYGKPEERVFWEWTFDTILNIDEKISGSILAL